MPQWLLFLICLALGAVLEVVYFLMRALQKKTALIPVTVILDMLFCALACGAFLCVSFFLAKAQFHLYMLSGIGAGFILMKLPLDREPKRASEDYSKTADIN